MKMKFIENIYGYYLFIIVISLIFVPSSMKPQRTFLDDQFQSIYRPLRLFALNLFGRSGEGRNLVLHKSFGYQQKEFSKNEKFFCDVKSGPGRRSQLPPTSVNELRPGDIDIIAGMGDSLTAGNGIIATNVIHVGVENRGLSWSIGGQGTWRKYLTLPNILKEFNPNLYGYSLSDGLSTDRSSKFNVAELGAMSRDMPYQAKVLVARMKFDPKVNMTEHWKMLSIFIGSNDFCTDMCYYDNPEIIVQLHKQDILKTLRFLRDNVPKLIVNILTTPDVSFLLDLKGKPKQCYITHPFECPCFIGKPKALTKRFKKIVSKFIEMDKKMVYLDEFNKKDFTVNVQPFTRHLKFPTLTNGNEDYTYFSEDCFHLSQKSHARSANAFWNNLLEPEKTKSQNWNKEFEVFKCPTEERPYFATRDNS